MVTRFEEALDMFLFENGKPQLDKAASMVLSAANFRIDDIIEIGHQRGVTTAEILLLNALVNRLGKSHEDIVDAFIHDPSSIFGENYSLMRTWFQVLDKYSADDWKKLIPVFKDRGIVTLMFDDTINNKGKIITPGKIVNGLFSANISSNLSLRETDLVSKSSPKEFDIVTNEIVNSLFDATSNVVRHLMPEHKDYPVVRLILGHGAGLAAQEIISHKFLQKPFFMEKFIMPGTTDPITIDRLGKMIK